VIWIRPADRDDVPWLLTQLQQFSAFYGTAIPLFPDDPAAAASILEAQLSGVNPFLVAVVRGDRAGFISGALVTHPYNAQLRVLQELFWWVDPPFRGTSVGARLFNEFVEFGRRHADWILMTLEAKSPIDPRSLERRGFQLHERSYLLEV
jgi:GNAT superfamily N-acetyltransferase